MVNGQCKVFGQRDWSSERGIPGGGGENCFELVLSVLKTSTFQTICCAPQHILTGNPDAFAKININGILRHTDS